MVALLASHAACRTTLLYLGTVGSVEITRRYSNRAGVGHPVGLHAFRGEPLQRLLTHYDPGFADASSCNRASGRRWLSAHFAVWSICG